MWGYPVLLCCCSGAPGLQFGPGGARCCHCVLEDDHVVLVVAPLVHNPLVDASGNHLDNSLSTHQQKPGGGGPGKGP